MKAKGLILWLMGFGCVSKAISAVFDLKFAQVIQDSSSETKENNCFGYSLDFTEDNEGRPWLIVGAPKDSTNVRNSGSIQACSLNSNYDVIKCKKEYPNLASNSNEIYEGQLLGINVQSVENEIVSCAPRYQYPINKTWEADNYNYINKRRNLFYVMKGHCFAFSKDTEFQRSRRIIPLEDPKLFWGRDGFPPDKTDQGYEYGALWSETGMAFHYDKDTKTKYWGAPGFWNWTGTFV